MFDIDNTLIPWKDEYVCGVYNALQSCNLDISKYDPKLIDAAIEDYDNHNKNLNKTKLLNFINNKCNYDLNNSFIDNLFKEQSRFATKDIEVEKTIKYLSEKYDLYVITNWFTEIQENRLKKMGILKYFKKVYGADINYNKPDPRCFDIILKDYSKKDCIYVGDNLEKDIKPTLNIGIRAIWFTNENNPNYEKITKISELMNIL